MKILILILATLGYLYNINRKLKYSYICWLISNTCCAILQFKSGEIELGIMFIIYDLFCIYGLTRYDILRKWTKG